MSQSRYKNALQHHADLADVSQMNGEEYTDKMTKFFVDWKIDQNEFNKESKEKLNAIFTSLEKKENRNDFHAQEKQVRNVFNELGKIGESTHKPALCKIAETGHTLVNLSIGIRDISKQFELVSTMASVGGAASSAAGATSVLSSFLGPIAALQPAFLIVGAGFALASLCGLGKRRKKKGSGIEPIVNAMRAIHEAVIEVHKAVIEVHQAVGEVYEEVRHVRELVCKMFDYLIEDVKAPILDGIASVDDSLHNLHIVSGLEHKELYLKSLSKLINRLSHVDDVKTLNQHDIAEILMKLFLWSSDYSCNDILTGRHFAKTGVIGNKPKWIKQVLSNPNHDIYNLVGYLALKAIQYNNGKALPGINENLLMNMTIWSTAVENYLIGLNTIDLEKYHPDADLDNMLAQIENYLAFTQFLSSNEDFYKNLFRQYNEIIQCINQVIDARFDELREKPQHELPEGSLAMEQLFPQASGSRVKLDFYLDALDDFHLLFRAYTQLGGLTKLYDETEKNLLTRAKIFSYKDDFFKRIVNGPVWSDGQGFAAPEHYETIRTSVFKLDDKNIFAAIVRQHDGVTIDLYDLTTNKPLANLPKGNRYYPKWSNPQGWGPSGQIYYRTIRARVIHVNGQPKIYVLTMHSTGFQLFSYDPRHNSWEQLPDPGLGIATGYESVSLELYNMTVNAEPRLALIVFTANGSQLNFCNPIKKTWENWTNMPVHKKNSDYIAGGYVIEKNGQDQLCLLSVSDRKFRIDEYDPLNKIWRDPVHGDCGLFDCSTIRAQALVVKGEQKLYISTWHITRLSIYVYDPLKNTIEFVCHSPAYNAKDGDYNKATTRLQNIWLNGQQKLLVMMLHSKGFEKHLFDPLTSTWQQPDKYWPLFSAEQHFDQAKCFSTIQCHVVDTHEKHQELFISARYTGGLTMLRYPVSPLHMTSSAEGFEKFLSGLQPKDAADYQPHFVETVLNSIHTEIILWKKLIAAKMNELPAPIIFSNKELQRIIKNAGLFGEKLFLLSLAVSDKDDADYVSECNEGIAAAIMQLKEAVNPAETAALLEQLINCFNAIDLIYKTSMDGNEYNLSGNIDHFLKSIRHQIKIINKPSLAEPGTSRQGIFKPKDENIKQEDNPDISKKSFNRSRNISQ